MRLYPMFEKWKSAGVIWVFSDPHFEDADCKLMDKNWISPDEQVARINAKVGKKDTLIILGDVGNVEYVKKLKGYKVLVMGNHDAGASNYKRKVDKEFIKVSNDVMNDPNFDECRLNGNFEVINKKVIHKYLEKYKNKKDFAGISGIETSMRDGDYLTITYDNKLFDEVYEGILAIGPDIILSHEPLNLPFGINVHGHCHAGEPVKKGAHSISFNLAANVIGYEPKRLDKLVEGAHYDDVHRLAIDKATVKKRKREENGKNN